MSEGRLWSKTVYPEKPLITVVQLYKNCRTGSQGYVGSPRFTNKNSGRRCEASAWRLHRLLRKPSATLWWLCIRTASRWGFYLKSKVSLSFLQVFFFKNHNNPIFGFFSSQFYFLLNFSTQQICQIFISYSKNLKNVKVWRAVENHWKKRQILL